MEDLVEGDEAEETAEEEEDFEEAGVVLVEDSSLREVKVAFVDEAEAVALLEDGEEEEGEDEEALEEEPR